MCRAVTGECHVVAFDVNHPSIERLRGRLLYACVGHYDPGCALPAPDLQTFTDLLESAPTPAQKRDIANDIALVKDWWRADTRWVRDCLSAWTIASVMEHADGRWRTLPEELAWSILNPLQAPEGTIPKTRAQRTTLQRPDIESARNNVLTDFSARAQNRFGNAEAGYRRKLKTRLAVLESELAELVSARDALAKRLVETPVEDDPRWAGRVAAAERAAQRARIAAESRLNWLAASVDQLRSLKPELFAELSFRPAPNDAF